MTTPQEHRDAPETTVDAAAAPRKKNVFILALNEFHRAKLDTVSYAERYTFHQLLDEIKDYDLPTYLAEAARQLEAFDGPIDAVIGYMDFPVSTMLPILCQRFGLRSATLEAVLKCEHKYWSRVEQRKAIPEHIPRFVAVDPFDDASVDAIDLPYPFWIKPVKSCGSYLGFRINGRRDLDRAIPAIRAGIGELAEPFQFVLDRVAMPPEVAAVDGRHCLAEEIITGYQCTLEGWAFDGEVEYHGVVDSIREPNGISFQRYEYPSGLPKRIQERMGEVARRILAQVEFDNSGFNIEFRWDRRRDRLWLIEINPRVAQHHSDLFEKVDGTSNHEVPIQIAVGARPRIEDQKGPFKRAATFFLRRYEDALVTRVPTAEEIAALEAKFPGTVIHLQVEAGMRLSELIEQDSYSYALAIVYVGSRNQRELLSRWHAIANGLQFGFDA